MKINRTNRGTKDPDTEKFYKEVAQQVNALSEGLLAANYNALPSIPTSGAHARGDEVRNSEPSELGLSGFKYVVRGWLCVASGTPGTWVEQRFPTGN